MLSVHFAVLSISGVWCPMHWSSKKLRVIYKFYSCIIVFLTYTVGLSQLARITFVRQNFDEFNDTFFVLLSTNFACFKAAAYLMKEKQVIDLIKMFEKDCCIFRSDVEKLIQKRCDNTCRKIVIFLLVMTEVTGIFMIVVPLFGDTKNQNLPYKVLLPYDLSKPLFYWLTYIHHSLSATIYAAVSITNDALITGFMLQVCGQLELLQRRLEEIPMYMNEAMERKMSPSVVRSLEEKLIGENVRHHIFIIKIAKTICATFSDIIIYQYCISAIEICLSVYQLSVRTTNIVELFTYSLYLTCMLGQLFVYCYFGNEVNVQSNNISYTIFSIDWTSMSIELKKDLMIMILFTSKPIIMSCGKFVHLLLESFTKVTRVSYSTFNVLHTSVN